MVSPTRTPRPPAGGQPPPHQAGFLSRGARTYQPTSPQNTYAPHNSNVRNDRTALFADLSFLPRSLSSNIYSPRHTIKMPSAFLTEASLQSHITGESDNVHSALENGSTNLNICNKVQQHPEMVTRCSCGADVSVQALTAAAESHSTFMRSPRLKVRGKISKIEEKLEEALSQSHSRIETIERELTSFRGRESLDMHVTPVEIVAGLNVSSLFDQESMVWGDVMQQLVGVVHTFCVTSGVVLERTRLRIMGLFKFAGRMIQLHRLAVNDAAALLQRKSYRAVFRQPKGIYNKQGVKMPRVEKQNRQEGHSENCAQKEQFSDMIDDTTCRKTKKELVVTVANTAEYLQMMANAKLRIDSLEQILKQSSLEISQREMCVLSPSNSPSRQGVPQIGGKKVTVSSKLVRRIVIGTRHRHHVRALVEDLEDIVVRSKRVQSNNSDEAQVVLPPRRIHHAESAVALLRQAHDHLSLLTRRFDEDDDDDDEL